MKDLALVNAYLFRMLHAFVRHLVKALVIYDHIHEKKGILKLYSRDTMPLKSIIHVLHILMTLSI